MHLVKNKCGSDAYFCINATLTKGIISRETGTDAHTAEHVFIIMCMPGQL